MKNNNKIYILVLIIIAIVSHLQWFNFPSILTSGDWQFRYIDLLKEYLGGWNTWINFDNFGSTNIQLFNFPIRGLAWHIFAHLGLSYDLIVKTTLLFLISIGGFLFPYTLIRRFVGYPFISFVASLTYATTIYFLIIQTRHLFIAIIFCLLPLIVYFFDKTLKYNRTFDWLIFSLVFIVGSIYELRIMYIVCLILILYFLFFYSKNYKGYIYKFILCVSVFMLLSLYWLFPLLFSSSPDLSEITGRQLFGNDLFNLNQAFTVFRWSWTGGFEDRSFIVQPIQWYLWTIPIIAFSSLLIRNKYKKNILFFSIIALIGIFLTKQSAQPFNEVYLWLYNNFPGFNLFREASKLYLLTAFGYLGLISFALLSLKESSTHKIIYYTLSIGLILVAMVNLRPLITTEIGGIFVNRSAEMPNDYLVLKDFIKEQNNFFRIGWIPLPVSWGYYTTSNPRVSFTEFQNNKWKYYETDVASTSSKIDVLDPFLYNHFKNLLGQLSIKYFVLPIREEGNYSNVFESYGEKDMPEARKYYIDFLNKIDYLKNIDIGTDELIVYENIFFKDYIRSVDKIISLGAENDFSQTGKFIKDQLWQDFDYIFANNPHQTNVYRISHLFDDIDLKNLTTSNIQIEFPSSGIDTFWLYKNFDEISGLNMTINGTPLNLQSKISRTKITVNPLKPTNKLNLSSKNYNFKNLVNNFSFEGGSWQPKVGDCHNFDSNPRIGMGLNKESKTNGNQSLQLESERHIACVSQKEIHVVGGKKYLFSFDYQSPNGRNAGYYIGFNDPESTVKSEKISIVSTNWNTFKSVVEVPTQATYINLFIYSYPTDNKTNIITRYDNFHLIELPDDIFDYWLVSEPEEKFVNPEEVEFELINPTKKLVHIKGATTPFYLAMSESYHPQWQAQFNNSKINGFFASWVPWVKPDAVSDDHHFELNGFLNGWYFDTKKHCETDGLCTKNADGSYDVELVLEFTPQRWFYLGLLISGTTLMACLGYLGYDIIRRRRQKRLTIGESAQPK